jgi:hypothetical protein
MGEVPEWTLGYQERPLTLEPSGRPVTVAGKAFLVVKFTGVTIDFSAASIPNTQTLPQPSAAREVRLLEAFEGHLNFAIGLDTGMPFTASVERPGSGDSSILAIRVVSERPRDAACANPSLHVKLMLPDLWSTLVTGNRACADLYDGTRSIRIDRAPQPPCVSTTVMDRGTFGGRSAEIVKCTVENTSPRYEIRIDWPDGAPIVVLYLDAALRAVADQVAASLEYVP